MYNVPSRPVQQLSKSLLELLLTDLKLRELPMSRVQAHFNNTNSGIDIENTLKLYYLGKLEIRVTLSIRMFLNF